MRSSSGCEPCCPATRDRDLPSERLNMFTTRLGSVRIAAQRPSAGADRDLCARSSNMLAGIHAREAVIGGGAVLARVTACERTSTGLLRTVLPPISFPRATYCQCQCQC